MNNEDRDEPKKDTEAGTTGGEAEAAALTPQDEEILLKRLRELGYVE
jgi:hypothetical protein